MKTYGIQILNGCKYEMQLCNSDMPEMYQYKLIPMELGYDVNHIYIAPNRERYIFNGKHVLPSEVLHFEIK